MAKITREKFRTYENVFDQFTLRNLFKLQNQGYFEVDTLSPVSIGKESNVFSAKDKKGKKVIIKIYRLETCDFNRMYDYIKFDPRYEKIKKGKRNIVFSWTQREFRNLMIAREANCNAPLAIARMHNILILEFIGKDHPALKLKDYVPETRKKLESFLQEIIKNMKKIHNKGLVHGDLSSFNILNFNDKPVFIDFSQATTTKSARADELLERDSTNISNFFSKHGLRVTAGKIIRQIK